jgi:cysteine-rich repeat protein
VANCCGNGTIEGSEACDDGNVVDKDGCNNLCKLPGGHLLITELVTSPSEAEFIELYNPSAATVALDKLYLSDRIDYLQVTEQGGAGGASSDFIARFPTGASLAAGAYAIIAIQGGLKYKMTYGKAPDYELKATDSTVPDMVAPFTSAISTNAGLTDGNEFVMLFTWDGSSDLIQDIDYVLWKSSGGTMVYKTSAVCIDGVDADATKTCYKSDTDVTKQSALQPASAGGSLHRCNYLEGAEITSGGNGVTGHDETSEVLGSTWKRNPNTLKYRTPGATAAVGFCPQ